MTASGLGCVKTFRSGPKLLPTVARSRSPRHSFIDQDHDDFALGVQVNRRGTSEHRCAGIGAILQPISRCWDRATSAPGLMHRSKPLSFNDLVCAGEQRRWDVEGKGLGSLR